MKEEHKKRVDEEYICWRAIPVEYDSFPKEEKNNYEGDVFGSLEMFESPHYLWRRFHKNYLKAILLTKLVKYELTENEDDGLLFQASKILEKNYSLDILARHNALVFLLTAIETFLKDSFKGILKDVFPEKIEGKEISKIVKKYNFQNIISIGKAFDWLCPNFNIEQMLSIRHPNNFNKIIEIDSEVEQILQMRHKIIHESFYDTNYTQNQFNIDSWLLFECAFKFENFFNDNEYWNKIPS